MSACTFAVALVALALALVLLVLALPLAEAALAVTLDQAETFGVDVIQPAQLEPDVNHRDPRMQSFQEIRI